VKGREKERERNRENIYR